MTAIAERTATKKPPTIGSLADQRWALKIKKTAANKVVDDIDKEIIALEKQIIEMLDSQDTRKGEGKLCSISINSSIVPSTKDWEAYMKFVAAGKRGDKNAYLHLVQKRVAVEAWRELLELGINIPGIEPFTARTLSVTALK